MKRILLALIRFYRRQLSPLKKTPTCRFIPTCSEYAYLAVERFGPAKGSLLAARRLSKCHPFHRQKTIEYDPVPKREPPSIRRRNLQ